MQAALQFYLEAKSPFSIDSDYKVDIYCWRDTMKKRIAAMKKSLAKIKKTSTVGLEPCTSQLRCFTD